MTGIVIEIPLEAAIAFGLVLALCVGVAIIAKLVWRK
jgi:Flp pilus assembly protein protease CpaA